MGKPSILAWRRRAHLCDLAWLAERLVGHEARPVRELAKTLVSEARRASLTRARWLARLAQAFGLDLAAMLEETAPAPRPRAPANGAFELGAHYCHVPGCQQPTPRLLMCGHHWFRVPPSLRRRVLRAYRAGQEVDKADGGVGRGGPGQKTSRPPTAASPKEVSTVQRGATASVAARGWSYSATPRRVGLARPPRARPRGQWRSPAVVEVAGGGVAHRWVPRTAGAHACAPDAVCRPLV